MVTISVHTNGRTDGRTNERDSPPPKKNKKQKNIMPSNTLSDTRVVTELTELRFYIPLDTKRFISETFFPANLLA